MTALKQSAVYQHAGGFRLNEISRAGDFAARRAENRDFHNFNFSEARTLSISNLISDYNFFSGLEISISLLATAHSTTKLYPTGSKVSPKKTAKTKPTYTCAFILR
jgi:hypothetical protein